MWAMENPRTRNLPVRRGSSKSRVRGGWRLESKRIDDLVYIVAKSSRKRILLELWEGQEIR